MKILRKLIISVVSLVAVVICFVATTYAWFDVNSEANVEGFNFTATSGLGFMISVDDNNYGNDISSLSIKSAIVKGYDSESYKFNSKGQLVDLTDNVVSEDRIDAILRNRILLLPTTSRYGYSMTDMYNNPVINGAYSGRYIEFDLYFKAVSGSSEENLIYDISLLVGSKKVTIENTAKQVSPTMISSETDVITLRDKMTSINGEHKQGDIINVDTMNSLRFSTEEICYKEIQEPQEDGSMIAKIVVDDSEETRKNNTKIYEFHNSNDLGSYAVSGGTGIYNSLTNAMFTYYNAQKLTDIEALDKNNVPETVRYQVGTDSNVEMPVITRVSSGSDSKRVTFRFWLEGWDADCFDGLSKSIKVSLTFTSKKV